jgi:hypothetical protein
MENKKLQETTFKVDLREPHAKETGAAAVIEVEIGRLKNRKERRGGRGDYNYETLTIKISPTGVNQMHNQLGDMQLNWSLKNQTWVARITKTVPRSVPKLQKGDIVLFPTGVTEFPIRLAKNKGKGKVEIDLGMEMTAEEQFNSEQGRDDKTPPAKTRQLILEDLNGLHEAIKPAELADYYDKLPEAIKLNFANRYLVANGVPIPHLGPVIAETVELEEEQA